jgi:hypothetical protein
LLDIKGDRHSLQAIDADGPFFADLAIQRRFFSLFGLLQ